MKWSLLQSGMVWSGAVAAITLIGLAAIPLSLSAQGTAGRVMIAGAEPTAQPEAIALAVSSIQEAHSAAPESSDNPFSSGDSVSPVTGVPNQNAPVATKATVWQVQGPVPSWLDSELDKEELRIANEIRSKLGKTHVDVDFNSVPLNNVLARIADTIGIDIYIDERSLKDFGVSVDEPITLRFKNPMTARDTLSLIMHRLCLSYTIRNGFVVVAYQETQRDPLRTYDLSYVLPDNSTVHELMGVIRSSVHPEAWDSGGGMGTLGVFGSMLVVKADEETHQDLERLHRELARQNKNHIQPTPQDPAQSSGPVGSTEMGGRGGAAIGDMGGMF